MNVCINPNNTKVLLNLVEISNILVEEIETVIGNRTLVETDCNYIGGSKES